jgi:hypothetical protein
MLVDLPSWVAIGAAKNSEIIGDYSSATDARILIHGELHSCIRGLRKAEEVEYV